MAEVYRTPTNPVLDNFQLSHRVSFTGAARFLTYKSFNQSASLERLPVEILDSLILNAAQFFRHSYDPSICRGGTNSWLQILRFKKGLPLICKALYWSGMKALYHDIVFRRMGHDGHGRIPLAGI